MLQEREFEPLGSERTLRADVRVIAATNRDLRQLVAEERLLEDLFHRLNVIPLALPPLRDRREDIPALVEHFVRRHAARMGKVVEGVSADAMARLAKADWPGNVRELENAVERPVVLTPDRVIQAAGIVLAGPSGVPRELPPQDLKENLEWAEREALRRALSAAGGVKKDAAESLEISQRALSY